MKPIVVDAMGGDNAPSVIVEGVHEALSSGIPVELVGDPARISNYDGITLHAALEVIEMDDEPGRAVRTKKDSSIVRAAECVRDGHASAMVSAGNTGAVAAAGPLGRLAAGVQHRRGYEDLLMSNRQTRTLFTINIKQKP